MNHIHKFAQCTERKKTRIKQTEINKQKQEQANKAANYLHFREMIVKQNHTNNWTSAYLLIGLSLLLATSSPYYTQLHKKPISHLLEQFWKIN